MKHIPEKRSRKTPQARMLLRRTQVATLYGRGMSYAEMARKLGVCEMTIYKDLKAIKEDWFDSRLGQTEIFKIRELERIDRIESAAWEGWERSRTDEETTRITTDGQTQKAEKVQKKRAGDPRFLDRITWCINKRTDLLGLDKPLAIPGVSADNDDLSPDERRDRLAALLDRLRQCSGTETDSGAAANTDAPT